MLSKISYPFFRLPRFFLFMTSKGKASIFLIVFVIKLAYWNPVFGQHKLLDSLKTILANKPDQDTFRVNRLNELASLSFSYNAEDLYKYGQQALILSKKLEYNRGEAIAYKNLALSSMFMHGDVSALNYLNKSLGIFSSLSDTVNMAAITNYIGCYYATVKDYKHALPYFLKAEKLFGNRKTVLRLTILTNTGSCYEDLRQYDKAREYYSQVRNLADFYGDYNWIVMSLYQSGSLNLIRKDYKTALDFTSEAFKIINSREINPRTILTIYLLQGDIRYGLGQYNQARKNYEKVAELARQMKSRENMAGIYFKFHLLDSIAGNFQGALHNLKSYQTITDSTINQNKNQIIALYNVKYALKEEEAENNRLLLEKKTDQKLIFYQRLIIGIALISLSVISFAFFRLKNLIYTLKNLNQKIGSQNMQLEGLNSIKNKIFSVIAHDLRNPFAQLISMLEMVDSKIIGKEEFMELVPFLNKSVHQGMEMMDNLLVWSKSQLNGFAVNPENIDLHELTRDTLEKLQSQITEKKLTVNTNKMSCTAAWADLEMIRIVIRNILSNAIKFTPVDGSIDIECYQENQSVVLAIKDSGDGIPKEQLDTLFSFNVKSTPGTANETGTGLGLKICMDMLELNQGKVWVESSIGKGSTFYISVPKKAV